jgi:pantoate--beta-alanine ligase
MAQAPKPKQGGIDIVRSVNGLRTRVAAWRRTGATIGLVPTMGALHDGHIALVRHALSHSDRVIASIFVNPTQFGPNEDFTRYPRDEEGDARMLAEGGCHLLYAPMVAEMYPPGFSTAVTAGAIAEGLCGPFRPGHFAGVATIVAKLLSQAQPDIACFGEKDYQQLQVIRRMVRDLDLPVRVEGVRTLRAPDGLALSSRNRYLAPEQRRSATAIYRVLTAIAERLRHRQTTIAAALAWGEAELAEAGFAPIDYLSACDAIDLAPVDTLDRPARVLTAAWLGKTRLIDNVALEPG